MQHCNQGHIKLKIVLLITKTEDEEIINDAMQELKIPIIALSQLNRETEKQNKPMLSNLKESGAIEQDADIVMFLYKTGTEEEKDIVHLYVAKHRNGALSDIKLFFHSQFCKFNDLLI